MGVWGLRPQRGAGAEPLAFLPKPRVPRAGARRALRRQTLARYSPIADFRETAIPDAIGPPVETSFRCLDTPRSVRRAPRPPRPGQAPSGLPPDRAMN